MSLLEHPTAQALLNDAEVTSAQVRGLRGRVQAFLKRYLPWFYREEQRTLAEVVIQGKLTHLERKTSEPIAYQAGVQRKPVQNFVGAGKWDDEAVLQEMRRHVAQEMGAADGVAILDPSGFAKKGTESCGVERQWCGRLGKVENCQVGVFLAYASARGHAPLDRRLYLPQEWAEDGERRAKCHVPPEVLFQERWRIGLDLLDRARADVPMGWVAGDAEFGRASAFRAGLRCRKLNYVLDVPSTTQVRDLGEAVAAGQRRPPWRSVAEWALAQPSQRWRKIKLGAGAKGPCVLRVLEARVQTRDDDGCAGPLERLVVMRTLDREARVWYALSNAAAEVPLSKLVQVHGRRHAVEELFQEGKGEVGLDHYEVRSWVGWHHHMTLSLLALWFLLLEKQRVGKKNPGHHGAPITRNHGSSVAAQSADSEGDRAGRHTSATPQRGSPHLPLLQSKRIIPAATRESVKVKRLQ